MTTKEQSLADDKMRAEIGKLTAEIGKLTADIVKLGAETSMLNKENTYYVLFRSMALGAAIVGATAAVTKIFF